MDITLIAVVALVAAFIVVGIVASRYSDKANQNNNDEINKYQK